MPAWDEPYIGDESMRRPPSWKKACMTAAHSSRSSGSSPTLKVIQLPRPTTGIFSPLDGIGSGVGVAGGAGGGGGGGGSGRGTTAGALAGPTPVAPGRGVGGPSPAPSAEALVFVEQKHPRPWGHAAGH